MKASQVFHGILILGVVAVFGYQEYHLARVSLAEIRAESFPTIQDHIISGEVAHYSGSKSGTHYYPTFTYTYEVDGTRYTGDQYRYSRSPTFGQSSGAAAIVSVHPPRSEVTVYYNPDDPGDSVLSTGADVESVSMLFLLGGFLTLVAALLLRQGPFEWAGSANQIAGGRKLFSEMLTTRVRLPRYEAGYLATIAVAIAGIAAGLIVVAASPAPGPSVTTAAEAGLGAVILAGLGAYLWQKIRIASGDQDLIIDAATRTVTLPLTFKRKQRLTFPFQDIARVSLEQIEHRSRYNRVSYTYAPTFELRDGTTERLADLSEPKAASFASWLRDKLGCR